MLRKPCIFKPRIRGSFQDSQEKVTNSRLGVPGTVVLKLVLKLVPVIVPVLVFVIVLVLVCLYATSTGTPALVN